MQAASAEAVVNAEAAVNVEAAANAEARHRRRASLQEQMLRPANAQARPRLLMNRRPQRQPHKTTATMAPAEAAEIPKVD